MSNNFTSFVPFANGTLFLLCFSFSLSAQEVIDNVQYRAVYNFSYKTKPEQTDFAKTDLMYLDIGQKTTKFYSRNEQLRDSVRSAISENGGTLAEITRATSNHQKGVTDVNYLFIENKTQIETKRWAYFHAYYEDTMHLPEWEIINESKKIGGFICQKAVTNFSGRDWTAYFTNELPFQYGPWKFWGLPGLIILITDKDNFFKFEMSGFEKILKKTPIINQIDNSYKKLTKREFQKTDRLYYEDPKSFMEINLHLRMQDKTSAKLPSIAHIPLEPW